MDGPLVSIDDYERMAKAKLPPEIFDYYVGGVGREWTVGANLAAFDKWILRPRVLVGVAERDTSTEVLGSRVSFPVLVAPWAFQSRADPDGEAPHVPRRALEPSWFSRRRHRTAWTR